MFRATICDTVMERRYDSLKKHTPERDVVFIPNNQQYELYLNREHEECPETTRHPVPSEALAFPHFGDIVREVVFGHLGGSNGPEDTQDNADDKSGNARSRGADDHSDSGTTNPRSLFTDNIHKND